VSEQPRRCVCPGSYDPVTNGHVDVITRAAGLFDEVVVAILHNPAKAGTFTVDERAAYLRDELADLPNVTVAAYANRLVVDVCREVGAGAMVKGLRGGTDYAYELPMALMNRHLTEVETLFLPGNPAYEHVSSSLVKEVVRFGGDATGLVPDAVRDGLVARLRER
jgi:pantetheine-phosphate adenylyltransferase